MDWVKIPMSELLGNVDTGKAKEYYEVNGKFRGKSSSYVCADGYPLGEWPYSQKTQKEIAES